MMQLMEALVSYAARPTPLIIMEIIRPRSKSYFDLWPWDGEFITHIVQPKPKSKRARRRARGRAKGARA